MGVQASPAAPQAAPAPALRVGTAGASTSFAVLNNSAITKSHANVDVQATKSPSSQKKTSQAYEAISALRWHPSAVILRMTFKPYR
jgi:hypothetical protein